MRPSKKIPNPSHLLLSSPALFPSNSPNSTLHKSSPFPISLLPKTPSFPNLSKQNPNQGMAGAQFDSDFEDSFPLMAEKLGGEGLIGELCKGFQLLKDGETGVITFESLKRNAPVLGLQGLSDEDLRSMISAGDFDGDGALSEMEFCVLMFRLSPELMDQSEELLDEALVADPMGQNKVPFFNF